MQILSSLIIPLLVLFIILYGIYKKVDIYDVFVNGSKESYDMIISMFPCMLAMIFGVNIFVKSGFLEWFFSFFKDILNNERLHYLEEHRKVFAEKEQKRLSGTSEYYEDDDDGDGDIFTLAEESAKYTYD